MEQLRLKMRKIVHCFFKCINECLSNDNCEKEKNSEQAYPTLYPEKQKYVHCTQRKIGHLFHDMLRDRKSQDFVKEISTYTLVVLE